VSKLPIKALAALALIACAGFLVFRAFRSPRDESEGKIYFYDESLKKLFAAPRDSIPPIPGLDNAEPDGVRAIVIAPGGDPKNSKDRRIAYLEKYTPELKRQFEAVRQMGAAAEAAPGTLQREMIPANTLVRRENEAQWHPVNSPEGDRIVTEWNVPGPNGTYPAVCVP